MGHAQGPDVPDARQSALRLASHDRCDPRDTPSGRLASAPLPVGRPRAKGSDVDRSARLDHRARRPRPHRARARVRGGRPWRGAVLGDPCALHARASGRSCIDTRTRRSSWSNPARPRSRSERTRSWSMAAMSREPAGRGARVHEHRHRRTAPDRDPRRREVRHRVAGRPRPGLDVEARRLARARDPRPSVAVRPRRVRVGDEAGEHIRRRRAARSG